MVTNASGTIVELSDYYPYGATRIDDQTSFNEQRKFAGHEYDAATGLSYMNARYYNGNYGRFVSQDEAFLAIGDRQKLKGVTQLDQQGYLTNPQAFNSYAYAYNNPLIYRDESGKFAPFIALGAYAVEYAPVWVPAAITWTAAAGIAITAPLVGGAAVSYSNGDQVTGDQMITTSMGVFGTVAAVGEGALLIDRQFNPSIAGNSVSSLRRNDLPGHAQDSLKKYEQSGWRPLSGYSGGRTFHNDEGYLPSQQDQNYYREWDVKPFQPGVDRGNERFVTGKGGEVYWTNTHYGDDGSPAFKKLKND